MRMGMGMEYNNLPKDAILTDIYILLHHYMNQLDSMLDSNEILEICSLMDNIKLHENLYCDKKIVFENRYKNVYIKKDLYLIKNAIDYYVNNTQFVEFDIDTKYLLKLIE